MPKINNNRYNQFLKDGIIKVVEKEDLNNYLKKTKV